ncbi:HEAT repeat domain-containing protein, partial [Actinomadura logoneensis]
LPLLAAGLGSPLPEVRARAVQAIAEIPDAEATALLRTALTDPDPTVRRRTALALGTRRVAAAVPALIDMVVEAANDVEAADALSELASDPASADRIAAGLIDRLTGDAGVAGDPSARRRVAQALADIPGFAASRALADLAGDEDPGVALTAAYILKLRDAR